MTSSLPLSATASGTKRYFDRIQAEAASAAAQVSRASDIQAETSAPLSQDANLTAAESAAIGTTANALEVGQPAPLLRYFRAPASFLGRTGLLVSKVGLGGYRMHEHDPDHKEAIKRALLSGVNVIDTSSNYTNGSSEKVFGEAIRDLIELGQLRRDEVVVVSKAGYIQGTQLLEARRLKEMGQLWPNTIELPNETWHSISPAHLEHSISKSLERLKLDCIDVLLIHNPEVFFKSSKHNIENRDLFYKRMTEAFHHLEKEVAKGRIRHYGVTSNGFPEPENQSTHVSLSRLIQSAEKAFEKFKSENSSGSSSQQHHFSVIQFPLNLFESNALLFPNQGGQTLLKRAQEHDLGVMSNRPFNSLRNGRIIRLAPFVQNDPVAIKGELHTALGRALELERAHPYHPKPAPQGLKWAHELREPLAELSDVLSWRDFAMSKIYPSIRSALGRLPPEAQTWRANYERAMKRLLDLITQDLECLANDRAQILVAQIDDAEPKLKAEKDLSNRALSVYWSVPGVSTILVGMRRPTYVENLAQTGFSLDESRSRAVFEKMQRHKN